MNGAITQNRLRPIIDRVFRLNDAKAAYAHFEAKQHVGKVVIADARNQSQIYIEGEHCE